MSAGGYGPRAYLCTCGRVVRGNAARWSHRQACGEEHHYLTPGDAYLLREYTWALAHQEVVTDHEQC